jgi:hypothetical protein
MDSSNTPKPYVVITGGSEGIGRAIAERYLAAGASVLIIGRDVGRLDATRAALASARLDTLALDVTQPTAPETIEAALTSLGGCCGTLVNSAGIGISGTFSAHGQEEIERLLGLNILAATRLMRHVLPGMIGRGRGSIINIASLGGLVPGPYQAAYYASKAYLISLSEAVAAEVAGSGVSVTAVAPGPVATGFHRRMGSAADLYLRLLPVQRATTVARWAVIGSRLGLRVVVPGILQSLAALALRLLPHRLSVPLVAVLLRPRGR